MNISNGQDRSCSCNQVRIELYGTDDTMKLRLPYCISLRINPLYCTRRQLRQDEGLQITHYSGVPTLRASDVSS
jgi:hypothetical protein